MYVEPSERVTSWVKVHGRFGRRMAVAYRTWYFDNCLVEVQKQGDSAFLRPATDSGSRGAMRLLGICRIRVLGGCLLSDSVCSGSVLSDRIEYSTL